MRPLSRSGQSVSVVALAVLAIVLGTMSVRHVRPVRDLPATTPLTAQTSRTPSPSDSTPTAKETTDTSAVVPLTRGISAVSGTAAYRVTNGTCRDGGGTLEATTDGGATWSALKTPLRTISRVQGTSDAEVFVVGSGPTPGTDCTLSITSSADGGRTWSDLGGIDAVWSRDLVSADRLHVPSGAPTTPCADAAVVDLTRFGNAEAYVLCADGTVVHTTDGGGTWKASGQVTGAVALMTPTAASPLVLATGHAGCAGVAVLKVAKGAGVGCLEIDLSRVEPGSVAGSATGGAAWVSVGDATYLSSDGGARWKPAKR